MASGVIFVCVLVFFKRSDEIILQIRTCYQFILKARLLMCSGVIFFVVFLYFKLCKDIMQDSTDVCMTLEYDNGCIVPS